MQRWNIIKKKNGNLNVGTGSQISDVHLATRRAVDMALGKPTMPSCSIANGRYLCISFYLYGSLMLELSEIGRALDVFRPCGWKLLCGSLLRFQP